jgi:hypothetical protein
MCFANQTSRCWVSLACQYCGGPISNPTWQPRDRDCNDFELTVNRNQPDLFRPSKWVKPNNLAYFIIYVSQFWSAKWVKPNNSAFLQ